MSRIWAPIRSRDLPRLAVAQSAPLIGAATAAVTADLNVLPNTSFEGLQYTLVQTEERPFFYIQNCSPTDAEAVKSVVADSLLALRPIMARHNLTICRPADRV